MANEADTCRLYVVPALQAAGWDEGPHSIAEQRIITPGRIVAAGGTFKRRRPKRVDYLLRYTRDFPLAVVEAKASYKQPEDGLQQAKTYAEMLGLKFAYATNGPGIVEFDYSTGLEKKLEAYPTPAELWHRYQEANGITRPDVAERVLTPANHQVKQGERYYQQIAINRTVEAILQGRHRVLVTMATGTGKTAVAFQTCWKLWNAGWSRTGEKRKPRILYLADRNILVDQPKDGIFAAFGDARWKLGSGEAKLGREIYFAVYQALAEDERRDGLFREFARDFFDLVIVDECHRGSARADTAWREILEYFKPAVQLGMTATPLRDDTRDTYRYFGNPVYEYSLRQGIADGFLAPYRVHRVITQWDAAGWRPSTHDLDRYGREIPDDEYQTKDFEHVVALRARTEAIARNLTEFLKRTGRFAKAIVFCVDQEHANEMRQALSNLNADLVAKYPDYVCRVTSDEGDIGRGHLSRFQDVESESPVILTTSQLLSTGVDAPTCRNVVLARVVGSMTEFKQIIGRGTRVREDYGKLFFNIVDYAGSATRQFADPTFDGMPAHITEEELAEDGTSTVILDEVPRPEPDEAEEEGEPEGGTIIYDPPDGPERRKYYFDGGHVEIAAHLVYDIDAEGKQLRVVQYTEYAAERVRTLCRSAAELTARWQEPAERDAITRALAERGIDLAELGELANHPDADAVDLLCHLAFNAPLRTRRERVERVRSARPDFFDQYGPIARNVLNELLDKYALHGDAQLVLPDVLYLQPIASHGSVTEIAAAFGGPEKLRAAVHGLQNLLYAA